MKNVIVRLDKPLKFGSSCSLLTIFLVKISETSTNGNIERFSPLSILAITALGTGIICAYLVFSFSILLLLPFSKKSSITLAVLSCARHIGMTSTIIDILPDSVGDKGLMIFPVVFVYLGAILVINIFVLLVKVKEGEELDSDKPSTKEEVDDAIHSYTNKTMTEDSTMQIECDEVKSPNHSAISNCIYAAFDKMDILQDDKDVNPTITNKNVCAPSSRSSHFNNTGDSDLQSNSKDFVCIDIRCPL